MMSNGKQLERLCLVEDIKTTILERIIEKDGHCLETNTCRYCPLRSKCLVSYFDKNKMITPQTRVNMALDIITRKNLLDDDDLSD